MKKVIKIMTFAFLVFIFVGCSDSVSDKEKDNINIETMQTKDDQTAPSKTQTLEDKFKKLQKDLKKEEGYILNEKLSYKEDEADGLKYIYGIEKQTDFNYDLYEISVYYNEDYAIQVENQWSEVKTINDNKKIGIYTNEENGETYYTYREDNMIINMGGYGNDEAISKIMKEYFEIDL